MIPNDRQPFATVEPPVDLETKYSLDERMTSDLEILWKWFEDREHIPIARPLIRYKDDLKHTPSAEAQPDRSIDTGGISDAMLQHLADNIHKIQPRDTDITYDSLKKTRLFTRVLATLTVRQIPVVSLNDDFWHNVCGWVVLFKYFFK